ncbi:ETS homologous factor-like isoform X2 [Heterodontus francisci]|uniref:ETS homologous factor-like isoform X2 n=1 Tax=Heterodontus francisci TaxID=7792 RepID=UPI00355C070A
MNIGDIGSALRSVYQLEDSLIPINCISPDPNQHSLSQHITALPPSDSQGPLKWFNTDPQFWGEEEILEWLSYYITKNKWDASFICLAPSHASGKQLCEMSFERFIGTFGYLGEDLYRSLRELRKKYEFEFQLPNGLENTESPFPPTEEEYKSSFKNIAKLKRRKRERPRKQWSESNDVLKTIKSKCSKCPDTGPHGTHLWEFILNILQNPDRNPGLLKWEDRTEGTFRFLRSDAVAQLWGQKKNNSSMTYEKLSRAMRYYYKKGILERVDGRQLVYKFGTNAKGWKRME